MPNATQLNVGGSDYNVQDLMAQQAIEFEIGGKPYTITAASQYTYFGIPITAGDIITIKNTSESGNIGFYTASLKGSNYIVETINASVKPGEIVFFTAGSNARFIAAYNSVTNLTFKIMVKSVYQQIQEIETAINAEIEAYFLGESATTFYAFPYALKAGHLYELKNTLSSGHFGFYSATGTAIADATLISNEVEAGETFRFIAYADAPFIAIYSNADNTEITISDLSNTPNKELIVENRTDFSFPLSFTYNYIFYRYNFRSGKRYKIKNTSSNENGNIAFWTASKDAEESRLQTVSNSLAPGASIEFFSAFNAPYVCFYSSTGDSFSIYGDNETLKDVVENEVSDITINELQILPFINRHEKYLTKVMFAGDSLIANEIGGYIPPELDEGVSKRPVRMNYNNIARRFYDHVSWNKPIWRRLDNADWTKSGFTEIQNFTFFDGDRASEKYFSASTSGAYIEINVPRGYEHFALVCRTKSGNGKLDVTLNGSSVGTYLNPYYLNKVAENTVVTSSVVPQYISRGESQIDTGFSTGEGNPLAVYTYYNLPGYQSNVIRFTTHDATEVDVWGGFYWTGNTCVIINVAHGGHTMEDLKEHYVDELFPIDSDLIVFEVPEMNNLRETLQETKTDLEYFFAQLSGKYVVYTSCNPLGLSIKYDTNFYTTYLNPSMLEVNNLVAQTMQEDSERFIDIFAYFTRIIESRGGTLMGGQGGLWYTHDGQHGNEAGVQMWFNFLMSNLIKLLD